MFVAPGFINIHSHASPDALPTAVNMLTQGVTTEIFNADGSGTARRRAADENARRAGLAVNIGGYIGFNSAWQAVVGNADRRPTPEEIERMRGMISGGLDQGAWGVSAGLDYKPGYFARTEEVIKVVDVAKSARTNFTNHDRITPESNFSSKVGIAETVAIGEKSGLVPVVTHMKAQGREQGTAGQLLASMAQATKRGHYTAADAYPYLAGQSGLGSLIIPGWAQEGGRPEMLKRFADPAMRARIVKEAEEAMAARFGGPQGVYLPRTQQELTAVMKEMNAGGGETIVRILEQTRRSRRDSSLRRGGRSDQDPAGSGDVDGMRLRRVDGDARASTVLRIVSAPARPLRARAEDHVVGAGDQKVVVAAGVDDRHERSRPRRARHGRGHRRLRSKYDHRSCDLRRSRAAVRRREARVRERRARTEGWRADEQQERPRAVAIRSMPSRPASADLRALGVKSKSRDHDITINVTQGAGVREATGVLSIDGVPYRPGFLQVTRGWASIGGSGDRAISVTFDQYAGWQYGDRKDRRTRRVAYGHGRRRQHSRTMMRFVTATDSSTSRNATVSAIVALATVAMRMLAGTTPISALMYRAPDGKIEEFLFSRR